MLNDYQLCPGFAEKTHLTDRHRKKLIVFAYGDDLLRND